MKSAKKYSFLIIYLLLPLPFIGLALGGPFILLPFLILFGFVPLLDAMIRDSDNPTRADEKKLVKDKYFRYVIYAYVPLQFIMLCASIYIITHDTLSPLEWIGFALAIGFITGGAGINLAHELMHKNSKLQQFLSKVLLSMVCYGYFFVEHVRGHHVRVATPDDPASAKFGQSFYHFFPRTIIGSVKSAFKLEKKRLEKKNKPWYDSNNAFWWIVPVPIAIIFACYAYGGMMVVAFFLIQSFVAIFALEVVNYIEHYGLERKKLDSGHYERVQPHHSWNANHWFSNIILFHLQRHSDHHTYGARPYQILRHMEDSPQLPSGYLGMMVLALIPPLWRHVMDPKVMAYRNELIKKTSEADVESVVTA